MTDFRALCAELLQAIDDDVIDTNDGPRFQAVVERVKAALAQPEPQGPSDEVSALQDACDAYDYAYRESAGMAHTGFGPARGTVHHQAGLRAVLARWGRPAIEPVPVAEWLPGPEDCDAEGRCWWWDDDDDMWRLHEHRPRLLCWTHWLPWYALLVPSSKQK
jgi:hypothetical protein